MNSVIVTHLVAFFFWGMPENALRNRVVRPLQNYMLFSGLWHIWGMFAPTPLRFHFDVRAEISYKDEKKIMWISPRMEEFSVWERAPKERYRKWRERIRSEEFSMVWEDTARYIAREMNVYGESNPPVQVKLTRYWQELPRPVRGQDFQPILRTFNPTNSFTYAVFPIQPEDLK